MLKALRFSSSLHLARFTKVTLYVQSKSRHGTELSSPFHGVLRSFLGHKNPKLFQRAFCCSERGQMCWIEEAESKSAAAIVPTAIKKTDDFLMESTAEATEENISTERHRYLLNKTDNKTALSGHTNIRWPRVLTPTYLSQIIRTQKNPLKALRIFNEARNKYPNYRHNGPVYATMINILCTSGRIADMKQVINQMKNDSCECQDSVFSGAIKAYAKAGMVNEAISLFTDLHEFNCVNWTESFNTMLQIMVKEGNLESAYRLFLDNFGRWEVKSRTRSLNWVIDVLCQRKRSDLALEVFQEMNYQCCYPTRDTYQTLMMGLCEDGRINEAIHLLYSMFWRISQKGSGEDVLIYKILINTLCDYGHVDEASDILNKVLRKGLKAPKRNRKQLDFTQCQNGRDIETAKRLINDALVKGVIPSYDSYIAMAVNLYAEGNVSDADKVLDEMRDRGFTPTVSLYEAKVMALCKKGMINKAEKVIMNCVPTVKLYNSIIEGLCAIGESLQALGYLKKMMRGQMGCVPNKDTYSVLVNGLCRDGRYVEASSVLEKMLGNAYWPDGDSLSEIIKGLCLMGRTYEAIVWVEEMISQEKMPEVCVWTCLVGCCVTTDTPAEVLLDLTNGPGWPAKPVNRPPLSELELVQNRNMVYTNPLHKAAYLNQVLVQVPAQARPT